MKRRLPLVPAFLLTGALLLPVSAQALDVLPNFNPNVIILDASFSDTKTFTGPEGIQRFLESKGSVLANTSPDFLVKLGEPDNVALKQKLDDPEPNLGRLRTAAELIWDASLSSGMNPQVILVTLHKEQGLIGDVSPDRLQRALAHAMGFDCPDSSGCGNLFPGFYYQLFGNVDTEGNRYLGSTKSLMKSFNTPGGRGPTIAGLPAHVGQSVTIQNTIGDYFGILPAQTVTIGNAATAALYRYTPHVFNGNYNFWKFFTSWFRYPNGTLIRSTNDGLVYIINDGALRRVPAFVSVARNLGLGTAISASPTEIGGYLMGPTYGPVDNTVISINGQFYVFIDSVKHPASSFVLTKRSLDPAQILPISADDAALFDTGSQLTPPDGTVLKGPNSPDVYLVDSGILKKYSEFTFKQHKAAKQLQIIPEEEIALYPKKGYVAPLNGTLIKSLNGDGVYLMSDERRLPLTPELFKNRGFSPKNVVALSSDEEIASIPVGPPATPKEGTFFSIDKELYIFKAGAKHPIFPFIAKQRGIAADYAFESSVASNWPDGIAVSPKDGTVLRGKTDATTYLVTNGQLRPLAGDIFKLLGLNPKKTLTAGDNEIEALAKGTYAEPPENTYFKVKGSGEFYVFMKGTKRRIYPFVAKQRGMTPDYAFIEDAVNDWTLGTPVMPREGTLMRAENTTAIYLVSGGTLRPLSTLAYAKRGYASSGRKINEIPATDLNVFPKGDPIAK